MDLEGLVEELNRAIAERRGEPSKDPRELSTAHLVAHIVSTHQDVFTHVHLENHVLRPRFEAGLAEAVASTA